MIFTKTVLISAEEIKNYNGILDGTVEWPTTVGHKDAILVASIDFDDGWEIDVNICKGESTPYVDAILFRDGAEIYTWEIAKAIDGEWEVDLGGARRSERLVFKLYIQEEE